MYYIGIDLGTSAVKLLLMQGDGQIANIVSREYPIAFPHPGLERAEPRGLVGRCLCRHSGAAERL